MKLLNRLLCVLLISGLFSCEENESRNASIRFPDVLTIDNLIIPPQELPKNCISIDGKYGSIHAVSLYSDPLDTDTYTRDRSCQSMEFDGIKATIYYYQYPNITDALIAVRSIRAEIWGEKTPSVFHPEKIFPLNNIVVVISSKKPERFENLLLNYWGKKFGTQQATVSGGQFKEAAAAYDRGDYKTAYSLFKALTEQGNAKAQTRLGVMNSLRRGVRQDYTEAMIWYRRAAEQGHAEAQNNLGEIYRMGHGVVKNYGEAMKWYRMSAAQGIPEAQFNLGEMYGNGQGVRQDHNEAISWYQKAAEQGFAEAQVNLGVMYGDGIGMPQDYVRAHMWFNLAASRFPESQAEERKAAIKKLDLISSKMTPAQIAEAQRLAREWKPKKEGK